MRKILKNIVMTISAILCVLCVIYLQVYGTWTTLLIDLVLVVLFCQAAYKSSRAWQYWIGTVGLTTYFLTFTGSRVRQNAEGRSQLVHALYPFCPKVYFEGTSIEKIELATGYSTFAGWYYTVRKSKFYMIKDTTNQITTIAYKIPYGSAIQGREMIIEEYQGPHGVINVFNCVEDGDKRVRRDFFGKNVDDEAYSVDCLDNAEYLPDYGL